jgi:bacterioferritin-associated ferredoxin
MEGCFARGRLIRKDRLRDSGHDSNWVAAPSESASTADEEDVSIGHDGLVIKCHSYSADLDKGLEKTSNDRMSEGVINYRISKTVRKAISSHSDLSRRLRIETSCTHLNEAPRKFKQERATAPQVEKGHTERRGPHSLCMHIPFPHVPSPIHTSSADSWDENIVGKILRSGHSMFYLAKDTRLMPRNKTVRCDTDLPQEWYVSSTASSIE